MTLPDTVQEYSKFAAESFIQTAVFIDDRIYERESSSKSEPRMVTSPRTRKKATKSATEVLDSISVDGSTADVDESADTYEIVQCFAKKQIVCSLYQPKKEASVSPSSDIFPLCKAADIVIIDWDLYGDAGAKAKELADGLIKQAIKDVPEQLRLILIYTQELNLHAIADELYQTVHTSVGDSFIPVENDDGLAFRTNNSRVVILGKPGRKRIETYERFEVQEKNLADFAIQEFAKMASGILHAATLLGLAQIRKSSRRILSKFSEKLDPAFLTHLAMSLPQEQATSHIVPLLVAEIESVLEDALPSPIIPEKILIDWCQKIWQPATHVKENFTEEINLKSIGEYIVTKGFSEAREKCNKIPKMNNNDKIREAGNFFLETPDDQANHQFAHLMSSRTFYGEVEKTLTLGTTVFDEQNNRYLLCMQPICDSVRIEEDNRSFLFAALEITAQNTNQRTTHVIRDFDGSYVELFYKPKSFNCIVISFRPTGAKKQVNAKISGDNPPVFTDISGINYRWVDQLKTTHAQRAVERLASDLSRVGLTEFEWFRKLEK